MNTALAAARAQAASMPLDQIDPASVQYFADGVELPYFERLRRDDPVHYAVSPCGPYWSITRYKDIMRVDTNPALFSSEWTHGGITLFDLRPARAAADVHRDGPAQARRAAQGGAARSSRRGTWPRWRR